jgi:hypothetical protein
MDFSISPDEARKTITINVRAPLAACLWFHAFLEALRLRFTFTYSGKVNPDAEAAEIDSECRPLWKTSKGGLSEGQMVCERVVITPDPAQQQLLTQIIMELVKKSVFPRVNVRK